MTRCSAILCIILLAGVLGACATDEPVEVYTRACNDSAGEMASLTYDWVFSTPTLAAGACTDYVRSNESMPRSPRVVFTADAVTYLIQANDVQGLPNSTLESGRWTYRLTIVDHARQLADVDAVADE